MRKREEKLYESLIELEKHDVYYIEVVNNIKVKKPFILLTINDIKSNGKNYSADFIFKINEIEKRALSKIIDPYIEEKTDEKEDLELIASASNVLTNIEEEKIIKCISELYKDYKTGIFDIDAINDILKRFNVDIDTILYFLNNNKSIELILKKYNMDETDKEGFLNFLEKKNELNEIKKQIHRSELKNKNLNNMIEKIIKQISELQKKISTTKIKKLSLTKLKSLIIQEILINILLGIVPVSLVFFYECTLTSIVNNIKTIPYYIITAIISYSIIEFTLLYLKEAHLNSHTSNELNLNENYDNIIKLLFTISERIKEINKQIDSQNQDIILLNDEKSKLEKEKEDYLHTIEQLQNRLDVSLSNSKNLRKSKALTLSRILSLNISDTDDNNL